MTGRTHRTTPAERAANAAAARRDADRARQARKDAERRERDRLHVQAERARKGGKS